MAKETMPTPEVDETVVAEVVETPVEEVTEDVAEEVAAEEVASEEAPKKGRESTSVKAKRAMAERAAAGSITPEKPVVTLDPLRLRGKKYRGLAKQANLAVSYSLEEAIAFTQANSISSFVGSIDAHIKVKGDAIRGTVTLPHGTGKTKNVAVADDATIEAIAAGKIDFDVLLATPAQMPKLAKFAKVLGPKGLMPSPKAGTVTDDIEKATKEISGGRIEYRADKTGVIHLSLGRANFSPVQLAENFKAVVTALGGTKILGVSIAPTMGLSAKVQL
jgi:large subunit ribosomal protein L1